MGEPTEIERLLAKALSGATPQEGRALLRAVLSSGTADILDLLDSDDPPEVRPAPDVVRGFRVRLDLLGAQPPVWRRLELPGDLTLDRVHDVVQAAMGWTDSHLHRFRTGRDPRSPSFVTEFDLEEGDEGVLENDVRLDQVVAVTGAALWYDYDFGDGWEHVLKVEAVLDEPPVRARCLAGRMACPPEDCGGMGGYDALARWVRSGRDDALLPDGFDDAAHAHDWLPLDWHPDDLDLDEIDAALGFAGAEPVVVATELAVLLDQLHLGTGRSGRAVDLVRLGEGAIDVTDEDATRLTETLRVCLDVVSDGVRLTAAGFLPPGVVEELSERSGITTWWIGKANREDLTPPAAAIRQDARALGLVSVRKGLLRPTAAGTRLSQDPVGLLRHTVARLPLGTKEFDRAAGWMALVAAGADIPAEAWRGTVGGLLFDLGWRTDRHSTVPPPAHSATLSVLKGLAGAARGSRLTGVDPAVAAVARAVTRRR